MYAKTKNEGRQEQIESQDKLKKYLSSIYVASTYKQQMYVSWENMRQGTKICETIVGWLERSQDQTTSHTSTPINLDGQMSKLEIM